MTSDHAIHGTATEESPKAKGFRLDETLRGLAGKALNYVTQWSGVASDKLASAARSGVSNYLYHFYPDSERAAIFGHDVTPELFARHLEEEYRRHGVVPLPRGIEAEKVFKLDDGGRYAFDNGGYLFQQLHGEWERVEKASSIGEVVGKLDQRVDLDEEVCLMRDKLQAVLEGDYVVGAGLFTIGSLLPVKFVNTLLQVAGAATVLGQMWHDATGKEGTSIIQWAADKLQESGKLAVPPALEQEAVAQR